MENMNLLLIAVNFILNNRKFAKALYYVFGKQRKELLPLGILISIVFCNSGKYLSFFTTATGLYWIWSVHAFLTRICNCLGSLMGNRCSLISSYRAWPLNWFNPRARRLSSHCKNFMRLSLSFVSLGCAPCLGSSSIYVAKYGSVAKMLAKVSLIGKFFLLFDCLVTIFWPFNERIIL